MGIKLQEHTKRILNYPKLFEVVPVGLPYP